MGSGWPWYGRVPELDNGRVPDSRLLQRVRVAPPGRDGPAQPVLVDVRVRPVRPADLPARVSAAGAGLPPGAAVAEVPGLAGPGGAGDEASGGDDERGDVLGGLAGDVGEY